MKQDQKSLVIGLSLALVATLWFAKSSFHQSPTAALEATPEKRTPLIRLAPAQVGAAVARRDQPQNILPVTAPSTTSLRSLLEHQAELMKKSDLGTQAPAIEAELDEAAKNLTADNIAELGIRSQDSYENQNKRSLSVYLLGKAGPEGIGALSKLATTNLDASFGETRKGFELGLRISALRALDQQSKEHGATVAEAMRKIWRQQKDPTLRMMAKVSLDGIQSARPQRLGRMLEQIVDTEGN
jgi:hypothetical protein